MRDNSVLKFKIRKDLWHFAGMLGIILAAAYLITNMWSSELNIPEFLPYLLMLIPIFALLSWFTDQYLIEDGVLYYYRWPGLKQRLCKVNQIASIALNRRKYGRYGYAYKRMIIKVDTGSKFRREIGVSPLEEAEFLETLKLYNRAISVED